MYVYYGNQMVEIDKEKFNNLPKAEKKKIILEIYKRNMKHFIESMRIFWLGAVDISQQDISYKDKRRIDSIKIYASHLGDGQIFSGISKKTCQDIINSWDVKKDKRFYLHVGSSSMYQDYTFNKYQMKKLIPLLQDILKEEWDEDTPDEEKEFY